MHTRKLLGVSTFGGAYFGRVEVLPGWRLGDGGGGLAASLFLTQVHVESSTASELQLGVDESYELQLGTERGVLRAATEWGVSALL